MVVTRLRNIFLGLLGIFLLIFVISLFFDRGYAVRTEIVIQATPSQVFPYLNSPREWDRWIAQDTSDTNYTYSYAGPLKGRSSRKVMKGPLVDITFRIKESHMDTMVRYGLSTADGEFSTEGIFRVTPDAAGTRVEWVDSGDVGYNLFARFGLKAMKERQTASMNENLQRLKALVEKK